MGVHACGSPPLDHLGKARWVVSHLGKARRVVSHLGKARWVVSHLGKASQTISGCLLICPCPLHVCAINTRKRTKSHGKAWNRTGIRTWEYFSHVCSMIRRNTRCQRSTVRPRKSWDWGHRLLCVALWRVSRRSISKERLFRHFLTTPPPNLSRASGKNGCVPAGQATQNRPKSLRFRRISRFWSFPVTF